MIDKQKLKEEVREELEALNELEDKTKDAFEELLEKRIKKAMLERRAGVRVESVKGLYAEALLIVNPMPSNYGIMDASAYRKKADAKPKDFYEKLLDNLLSTFKYSTQPASLRTIGYVYREDLELIINIE